MRNCTISFSLEQNIPIASDKKEAKEKEKEILILLCTLECSSMHSREQHCRKAGKEKRLFFDTNTKGVKEENTCLRANLEKN